MLYTWEAKDITAGVAYKGTNGTPMLIASLAEEDAPPRSAPIFYVVNVTLGRVYPAGTAEDLVDTLNRFKNAPLGSMRKLKTALTN
jgi:hypothetical protein